MLTTTPRVTWLFLLQALSFPSPCPQPRLSIIRPLQPACSEGTQLLQHDLTTENPTVHINRKERGGGGEGKAKLVEASATAANYSTGWCVVRQCSERNASAVEEEMASKVQIQRECSYKPWIQVTQLTSVLGLPFFSSLSFNRLVFVLSFFLSFFPRLFLSLRLIFCSFF